jgi:hypothetical protein
MNHESFEDVPKTIGELRQRLRALNNPWEVDPRLGDDDPLLDRPRGGQTEGEIPDAFQLSSLEPDSDVLSVIAQQLPTNPFLRARWVEVGLLEEETGLLSASSDEEWGEA